MSHIGLEGASILAVVTPPQCHPDGPVVDVNQHDVFQLYQHFELVINRYDFFLAGPAPGEVGPRICFVEQERFSLKEDIRFFSDESQTVELLRIKARQIFDPKASYDVTDANGTKIGEIQKLFGHSLLRSTYAVRDAHGADVMTATEKRTSVALLRRAAQFAPYVNDYADWLPIPYDFMLRRGNRVLGSHVRHRYKLIDSYTLDLSPDTLHSVDRRLALALAVMLDALQAR